MNGASEWNLVLHVLLKRGLGRLVALGSSPAKPRTSTNTLAKAFTSPRWLPMMCTDYVGHSPQLNCALSKSS